VYMETKKHSEFLQQVEQTKIEQAPAEVISFDEWKDQLEKTNTAQDYLHALQSAPTGSEPEAVREYFFGSGGVVETIEEKKLLPIKDHSYSWGDPDADVAGYIEENGFESAVNLAMVQALEDASDVLEEKKNEYARLAKELLAQEHSFLTRSTKEGEVYWATRSEDIEVIDMGESSGWEDDESFFTEDMDATENGIRQIQGILRAIKKHSVDGLENEVLDSTMDMFPAAFTRQVSGMYSEGSSGNIADVLLKRLRDSSRSNIERDAVGRVLYLIELGKIGISENVVSYLEKKYELQQMGEEKQFDFARRITGDGKVGLFETNGALAGFFELGDLAADDERRQAQVLEVSRDLLFADPNTPDEIRQQFLADYTDFYEKVFGEVGGVRMSDLSLREQVWMYSFWRNAEPSTWDSVKELQMEYGFSGIKSFIAGEYDAKIGEKIIAFTRAQGISNEKKHEVFDRFSRLADQLDDAETLVAKYASDQQPGGAQRVTAEIAKRAARMLGAYIDAPNEQALNAKMEGMREDVVLFAAAFKALLKGKEISDLSEIAGIDFEMVGPSVLSERDKEQMRVMLKKNNQDEEGQLQPFAEEVVLPSMEKSFSDESNRYFLLRQDGNVIAYFRMQDRADDVYFGSFNVDADAIGAGLGSILMEKRFAKEAKGRKIVANVTAKNPAAGAYVNQHEFVITDFLPDVAGTGTDGFTIVRDDTKKDAYISRFENVEAMAAGRVIKEQFNLNKDREAFTRMMEQRVTSGEYVVTHYSINPKTGKGDCVFERIRAASEAGESVTAEAA